MKHEYSTYALIGLLTIGAIVSVSAVLWNELTDFPTQCSSLGEDYAVTNISTILTCARFVLYNTLQTCPITEVSTWNGTEFNCITTGGGSADGTGGWTNNT